MYYITDNIYKRYDIDARDGHCRRQISSSI